MLKSIKAVRQSLGFDPEVKNIDDLRKLNRQCGLLADAAGPLSGSADKWLDAVKEELDDGLQNLIEAVGKSDGCDDWIQNQVDEILNDGRRDVGKLQDRLKDFQGLKDIKINGLAAEGDKFAWDPVGSVRLSDFLGGGTVRSGKSKTKR